MNNPNDETLMAFADGALEGPEAERIAGLARSDPAIAQRIEMFRDSRRLVADALKPLAAEPVPAELDAAVRNLIANHATAPEDGTGTVVAFPQHRATQRPLSRWTLPLAASLAAIAVGTGGFMLGQKSSRGDAAAFAAVGDPLPADVTAVLASAASGSETRAGEARMRLVATVMAQDGSVCREFEIDIQASARTAAGVACRNAGEWRLVAAVAAVAGDGGYAPASSLTALDAYLDAIGASEPLSTEEEREALTK
jgi:anti-sigma factor RsiW